MVGASIGASETRSTLAFVRSREGGFRESPAQSLGVCIQTRYEPRVGGGTYDNTPPIELIASDLWLAAA